MNEWKTVCNTFKPSPATRKIVEMFSNADEKLSVLDFGAGRGRNSKFLFENNFVVMAYDKYKDKIWDNVYPLYDTLEDIGTLHWNIVLCSYVINVLKPYARDKLIKELFELKWDYLILETRDVKHIEKSATDGNWRWYADGYITGKETFQKGFDVDSMKELLYNNTSSILYIKDFTKKSGNTSIIVENLDELKQHFYQQIFKNWPKKDD